MKNKPRGGLRPGSGRPKKEVSKVLHYRVPDRLASKINKAVKYLTQSLIDANQPKQ